jgi:hypothetical protein
MENKELYKKLLIVATLLKTVSFASSFLAGSVYSSTFIMFDWIASAKSGFFMYNGITGVCYALFVLTSTNTLLRKPDKHWL